MPPAGVALSTQRRESSRAGRLGASSPTTLAVHLREVLRDFHAATEASLDLPNRLGSLAAYAELLVSLDRFLVRCEAHIGPLGQIAPADLCDGLARRRERLRDDLDRLGVAAGGRATPDGPALLATADHRVGAWYVVEGSALGGLVVAAQVRRVLPQAALAVSYFSGDGRTTAGRWRRFQSFLTAWETRPGHDRERVVAGARAAFVAAGELLGATT